MNTEKFSHNLDAPKPPSPELLERLAKEVLRVMKRDRIDANLATMDVLSRPDGIGFGYGTRVAELAEHLAAKEATKAKKDSDLKAPPFTGADASHRALEEIERNAPHWNDGVGNN